MNDWLPEKHLTCPFCGENISVIVDVSAGSQSYIEDCQVCCQPMQIRVQTDGDELVSVSAEA